MFAGAAFFALLAVYRGTRADPKRIVHAGGFLQGGFSALLLVPTLGMKAFAAAVPLAFAASAFLFGAAGIRRKALYIVGAAATVLAIVLLLILDPTRTDPIVAAFVVVPAVLLAWLATRTS